MMSMVYGIFWNAEIMGLENAAADKTRNVADFFHLVNPPNDQYVSDISPTSTHVK